MSLLQILRINYSCQTFKAKSLLHIKFKASCHFQIHWVHEKPQELYDPPEIIVACCIMYRAEIFVAVQACMESFQVRKGRTIPSNRRYRSEKQDVES